jgi:hypothetical protein
MSASGSRTSATAGYVIAGPVHWVPLANGGEALEPNETCTARGDTSVAQCAAVRTNRDAMRTPLHKLGAPAAEAMTIAATLSSPKEEAFGEPP